MVSNYVFNLFQTLSVSKTSDKMRYRKQINVDSLCFSEALPSASSWPPEKAQMVPDPLQEGVICTCSDLCQDRRAFTALSLKSCWSALPS